MKKINSQTKLAVYMALCLVIGALMAYYFTDEPNKTFLWDMTPFKELSKRLLMVSGVLFIGGFIKGRFLNVKK